MIGRNWKLVLITVFAWLLIVPLVGCGSTNDDTANKSGNANKADEKKGDEKATSTPGQDAIEEQKKDYRAEMLIASVTIFVLAIFVGFEVITKVPPTLHTPLMSGSNAISGITVVGAVIVAGTAGGVSSFVGMLAVGLATINVVGGFWVTHRMLSMFKKK